MNCPACNTELILTTVSETEVHVCKNGCGSLWLNIGDIKKFDTKANNAEGLINLPKKSVGLLISTKRKCPVCTDVIMIRHFYGIKQEVEIDECGMCGGTFLDAGKLEIIREQYSDDQEREKEENQFVNGHIAPHIAKKEMNPSDEKKLFNDLNESFTDRSGNSLIDFDDD